MKKVLIAIESQLLTQILTEALESDFQILHCHDGEDALGLIYDFRPELLVLDLMLPKIDGVSVLRATFAAGIYPKVVAISEYISSSLLPVLEKMGLQALIKTPVESHLLVATILEIANTGENKTDLLHEILNLLALLGFSINTGGCRFVEAASYEYIKNDGRLLMSQLYLSVATSCGGTATQVEKAIRDSVNAAWSHRNELIWRMYFATGKDGKVRRPTNAVFFARIARCIANSHHFEYSNNEIETIKRKAE